MTKPTITREQLEEWVAQFDEDGGCDATDRQLEALIRQSLAAMDGEPVRNPVLAYADSYRDMAKQGVESVPIWSVITDLERNIAQLYRHAQPAPDEAQSREAFEKWCQVNIERNKWHPEFYAHLPAREQWAAWEACRAAMLQGGTLTNEGTSLQDNHSVDDTEKVNSPVIPDGYVMVPKEMTDEIGEAIAMQANCCGGIALDIYAAMLAAAPQSPGSEPATVPGKWIPVSERMPEVGDIVLTAMGGAVNVGEMECSAANCRFFTSVISGRELPATHWMPLPAGPQEAQGE